MNKIMRCGHCGAEFQSKEAKDGNGNTYFKCTELESIADPTITENEVRSLACVPCRKLISLVWSYRDKFEKTRNSVDGLKHELNMFRSVMLMPNTMSAIADDPLSEQPNSFEIKRRVSGLEILSLGQLLFWMQTYEIYAREIAALVHTKASEQEITKHLEEKTRQAIKSQAKRKEDIKKKYNDGLTGTYTNAEKKVVVGMMKTLNINEQQAVEFMRGMGKQ
jgi:hypothetical protein